MEIESIRSIKNTQKRTITLVITLLYFSVGASAQAKFSSVITGTVIDSNGSPVVGANVTFDNSNGLSNKGCWVKDNAVFTDISGRFVNKDICSLAQRSGLLFISRFYSDLRTLVPISTPFWADLQKYDKRFAGMEIQMDGNRETILGNVPVQVSFATVEVFVLNKRRKPLYASLDDWSNFILIVRNDQDQAVGSASLSTFDLEEGVVNVKKGSVLISLPEGTWTLEMLKDWNDFLPSGKSRKYLARSNMLVNPTADPIKGNLVVGTNKP